jgi:hypothetical protein
LRQTYDIKEFNKKKKQLKRVIRLIIKEDQIIVFTDAFFRLRNVSGENEEKKIDNEIPQSMFKFRSRAYPSQPFFFVLKLCKTIK